MPFIDTHCHLDAPAYDNLAAVCRRSEQAGVDVTVAVGTGPLSNRRILALQQQQPGRVWAALGLHPERPEASWEEVEAVLDQLRSHRDRVVALGEVGLPHYALLDGSMSVEQARRHEAFLHALVKGAVALGLPVISCTRRTRAPTRRWPWFGATSRPGSCFIGTRAVGTRPRLSARRVTFCP
jgi:TatD DNase family protein